MRKIFKISSVSFLLIFFFSCSSDSDELENQNQQSITNRHVLKDIRDGDGDTTGGGEEPGGGTCYQNEFMNISGNINQGNSEGRIVYPDNNFVTFNVYYEKNSSGNYVITSNFSSLSPYCSFATNLHAVEFLNKQASIINNTLYVTVNVKLTYRIHPIGTSNTTYQYITHTKTKMISLPN